MLITRENFRSFADISNKELTYIHYRLDLLGPRASASDKPRKGKRESERTLTTLFIGLQVITGKPYIPCDENISLPGNMALLIIEDTKIGMGTVTLPVKKGDILLLGEHYRTRNRVTLPQSVITLLDSDFLRFVYTKVESRLLYKKVVLEALKKYEQLFQLSEEKKTCVQKELHLDKESEIGRGCYGTVYKSAIQDLSIAIKLGKQKKKPKKFTLEEECFREVYFLDRIIRPIIESGICPNLPLLYRYTCCEKCRLIVNERKVNTPCTVMLTELAEGNAKEFFINETEPGPFYSALFQIMAGLHTLQITGQVLSYDIKRHNILVYEIKPGGYWKYTIRGKNYYVPNYGKLFVINDFGISRPMSPIHSDFGEGNEYRLGSRYGIVYNGKIRPLKFTTNSNRESSKFSDIKLGKETIKGAEFILNKKTKKITPEITVDLSTRMRNKLNLAPNITVETLVHFPEIFPCFEFYNDTQDVIRMFTGGKRSTQSGHHHKPDSLPKRLKKELRYYNYKSDSAKDKEFSTNPAHLLAGYFIEDFFGKYTDFTVPRRKVLESYVIE